VETASLVFTVAALVGVPAWAIMDVALDVRDRRRNIQKTRNSLAKYVIALVGQLILGGVFVAV